MCRAILSLKDIETETAAEMGSHSLLQATRAAGLPSAVPEPVLEYLADGPPTSSKSVLFYRDAPGLDPMC